MDEIWFCCSNLLDNVLIIHNHPPEPDLNQPQKRHSTGEIMRSTDDSSVLKQRLRLLRSLRAGLRVGQGRLWIRLESNKKHDGIHGEYPTIEEILGISRDDMATANGYDTKSNAWRSLFKPSNLCQKGSSMVNAVNCGFISVKAV